VVKGPIFQHERENVFNRRHAGQMPQFRRAEGADGTLSSGQVSPLIESGLSRSLGPHFPFGGSTIRFAALFPDSRPAGARKPDLIGQTLLAKLN